MRRRNRTTKGDALYAPSGKRARMFCAAGKLAFVWRSDISFGGLIAAMDEMDHNRAKGITPSTGNLILKFARLERTERQFDATTKALLRVVRWLWLPLRLSLCQWLMCRPCCTM